jgi:hypothetical protein
MNREQFDNTFSLFQLSEIIHSHQSTSQVAKSIQEQLINNRWDLDDSIAQLLKFSF